MIIIHAGLVHGDMFLWGESKPDGIIKPTKQKKSSKSTTARPYPFLTSIEHLGKTLQTAGIILKEARETTTNLYIPATDGIPVPSSPIIFEMPESDSEPMLTPWKIDGFLLSRETSLNVLRLAAESEIFDRGVIRGKDLIFLTQVYRFAAEITARQRYLPALKKKKHPTRENYEYHAAWEPVLDTGDREYLEQLSQMLPHSCLVFANKTKNVPKYSPTVAAQEILADMVDACVRGANKRRGGKFLFDSLHDQWMYCLCSPQSLLSGYEHELEELYQKILNWRKPATLTAGAPFKLCFRLEDPYESEDEQGEQEVKDDKWYVRYFLQDVSDPSLMIPVHKAWQLKDKKIVKLFRQKNFNSREYLLQALGKASGVSGKIEKSLKSSAPQGYPLDIEDAYEFLTEKSMILEQMGFTVFLPAWWSLKGTKKKVSARAQVKTTGMKSSSYLTMDTIVDVNWELALGEEKISLTELESLARLKAPLVRFRGQWVQLSADEIRETLQSWDKRKTKTTVREVVRMDMGLTRLSGSIPVSGIDSSGIAGDFFKKLYREDFYVSLEQPQILKGTLRNYQKTGYSWMDFLKARGLGACLADDMGLGKTIQVLSLIARDWNEGNKRPVLVVCPTSVIGNWYKEAQRFTPDLPVLIHHGADRKQKDQFRKNAEKHALVISSYNLLQRDSATFSGLEWGGVVLDEAQNIKNPDTRQAKAARGLKAGYRIALTGTPVENHIGELWSILEFLNPGFLGSQKEFKTTFHNPIHGGNNKEAAKKLKKITSPFILRRLKTDTSIIADLPEKMEMKVFCTLTKEQASLYTAVTKELLDSLDELEGIQRRGNILAAITKLKQICNHPAHFLGDNSSLPERSGKLERIVDMLEEMMESGESALLFTQFTEMGNLLKKHIQETLGAEVLFLHGGVPAKKRNEMVERFQNSPDAPKIFILSLKAGGTGLNLTGANHVFHFDRWWNPAVENQATDRAFRIGQTKNVEVHKFICLGTIEERIDEMIEKKKEIADMVVGTGEGWVTELSDKELRDLVTLRHEVIGV